MKLPAPLARARAGKVRRPGCAGMTLPEVMVTSAIFGMAIAGFLALQLFALKADALVGAKLGASDEARDALGRLVAEVRTAGLVRIGTGDESSFTEVPMGEPQRGSAIQVYPSKTDTNTWIRYFWDPVDTQLKRTVNGDPAVAIVAHAITNQLVFTSEDFQGQVLTNNHNNRVIGLTLQFYQLQFPSVSIGPGYYYDFYQLRTRITRRALE